MRDLGGNPRAMCVELGSGDGEDQAMVPSAWLHRRATSTIGPSDAVVVAVEVLDELVKCTLERCRTTSEGYCIVSAPSSTPSTK